MCDSPDLAAEISLQPLRRFGMDGVVVFSDILLPLRGGGLELEFAPGPVIANPLRGVADLDRLSVDVGAAIAPTCEALRRLRRELGSRAALIGFAGAPWTLAAYATESRLSRDVEVLSALSWREPETLQKILERTAQICADDAAPADRRGRRLRADLRHLGGRARPRALRAVRRPRAAPRAHVCSGPTARR